MDGRGEEAPRLPTDQTNEATAESSFFGFGVCFGTALHWLGTTSGLYILHVLERHDASRKRETLRGKRSKGYEETG
jgi:hypothetical protein